MEQEMSHFIRVRNYFSLHFVKHEPCRETCRPFIGLTSSPEEEEEEEEEVPEMSEAKLFVGFSEQCVRVVVRS
jgi:hypothetical protein